MHEVHPFTQWHGILEVRIQRLSHKECGTFEQPLLVPKVFGNGCGGGELSNKRFELGRGPLCRVSSRLPPTLLVKEMNLALQYQAVRSSQRSRTSPVDKAVPLMITRPQPIIQGVMDSFRNIAP